MSQIGLNKKENSEIGWLSRPLLLGVNVNENLSQVLTNI